MIKKSFIFLEGIGNNFEKRLWENGIINWDSFISAQKIKGISKYRKLYYDRVLLEAKKALYSFDMDFFLKALPQSEMWRLYDFFREDCVFLDIETDGIWGKDDITVFGLYDGLNSKIMIRSINLDFAALKKELQKYKLMVTFNGATFDVPFIQRRYKDLLPSIPNFDVRCLANRLGFKGGLKAIEKQMGIQRTDIVKDFYGGDAVSLWRMYRATGDKHYLNLLVEYNEFDVVNLKLVADRLIKIAKNKLFSEQNRKIENLPTLS